jgi:hypothetical protein
MENYEYFCMEILVLMIIDRDELIIYDKYKWGYLGYIKLKSYNKNIDYIKNYKGSKVLNDLLNEYQLELNWISPKLIGIKNKKSNILLELDECCYMVYERKCEI